AGVVVVVVVIVVVATGGVPAGGGLSPLPVSTTVCGPSDALSPMRRLACRSPAPSGVNTSFTSPELPAAESWPPQASEQIVKSPASVPPSVTVPTDTVTLPLFVRVTDWTPLGRPTSVWPKSSTEGLTVADLARYVYWSAPFVRLVPPGPTTVT